MVKSAKHYLVYDASALVKVTDQAACEAELYSDGKWVEANHFAADVTGMGGGCGETFGEAAESVSVREVKG